jgi:hypothetical protein
MRSSANSKHSGRPTELTELPVRIVQLSDEQSLEWQIVELSIVDKCFHRLHATLHVAYM